jgi:hypothetical protein
MYLGYHTHTNLSRGFWTVPKIFFGYPVTALYNMVAWRVWVRPGVGAGVRYSYRAGMARLG